MYSFKRLLPDIVAKITLSQHRQTIQGPREECQRLPAASVAPIHKCPHELLVMIFKLYVSNKPFLICHILLVCKTWHAIAVGTPSFWTKIFINIATREVDAEEVIKALRPRIEASLLRSQPLLLDIRLDLRSLVPFNALRNRPHVLRFLQSFVGRHGINMVRWKSLDIIFPYGSDKNLCTSILGLFVGPTPHLTTLSLGVRTLDTLESLNPIFPDLSSLKSLDIDSVEFLDRFNAPFSSLENLSMACSYAAEFQIARLHRFTSLTTLTIRPGLRYYRDNCWSSKSDATGIRTRDAPFSSGMLYR
jgi:F-box-like